MLRWKKEWSNSIVKGLAGHQMFSKIGLLVLLCRTYRTCAHAPKSQDDTQSFEAKILESLQNAHCSMGLRYNHPASFAVAQWQLALFNLRDSVHSESSYTRSCTYHRCDIYLKGLVVDASTHCAA